MALEPLQLNRSIFTSSMSVDRIPCAKPDMTEASMVRRGSGFRGGATGDCTNNEPSGTCRATRKSAHVSLHQKNDVDFGWRE